MDGIMIRFRQEWDGLWWVERIDKPTLAVCNRDIDKIIDDLPNMLRLIKDRTERKS